MNLQHIKHIYFLGIGGIGMSALAAYFLDNGITVSGYDRIETNITKRLQNNGASISFELSTTNIDSKIECIVYTPAIKSDNILFSHLADLGIPMIKRSDMLSLMAKDLYTIAIAGTHGKTTITSMLCHIFMTAQKEFIGFVGGITKNYNSNLVSNGEAKYAIVEADEFDRSFLKLFPNTAIISSIDPDHLDIYSDPNEHKLGFEQFCDQIDDNGLLIMHEDVSLKAKKNKSLTYGFSKKANIRTEIKNQFGFRTTFDFQDENGVISDLILSLPGWHNVLNMSAAIAIARKEQITDDDIKRAVSTYNGVKRRFDIQFQSKDVIYIDDYAHHPGEIDAVLSSVKQMMPDKKLTVLFQPHLYSRTQDFADEFALSLSQADQLGLIDIYPAREKPIAGVDTSLIAGKLETGTNYSLLSKDDIIPFIESSNPEILLTLGAGDIDQFVDPIRIFLERGNDE